MDESDAALEQLLESWRTNNRINLFLIDKISDEGMRCTLSTRGGRNVTRQFAHLHTVRVWQLENRRAKDLAEGLHRFATADEPSKAELKECLTASGRRIEQFLSDHWRGENNRRGMKKGTIGTLSYFINHESHHRGNILLTLKQSGHKLDKKSQYAIYDWDRR